MTGPQITQPAGTGGGGGGGGGGLPSAVYEPIDVASYQIPDDAAFVGFTGQNHSTPTVTLPQNPTPGQKLTIALVKANPFNPNMALPSGYTSPQGLPGSLWNNGAGSWVTLQFTDNVQKVWERFLYIE